MRPSDGEIVGQEGLATTISSVAQQVSALEKRMQTSDSSVREVLRLEVQGLRADLAAQKEAMTAAFAASEKAITKAEIAQQDYNMRSNEFRGQLDDQAKRLMPRNEAQTLFRGIEDRLISLQHTIDERFSTASQVGDGRFTALERNVDELRLSKATLEGKASQQSVNVAFMFAAAGLLLGTFGIVLQFLT